MRLHIIKLLWLTMTYFELADICQNKYNKQVFWGILCEFHERAKSFVFLIRAGTCVWYSISNSFGSCAFKIGYNRDLQRIKQAILLWNHIFFYCSKLYRCSMFEITLRTKIRNNKIIDNWNTYNFKQSNKDILNEVSSFQYLSDLAWNATHKRKYTNTRLTTHFVEALRAEWWRPHSAFNYWVLWCNKMGLQVYTLRWT